MRISVGIRPGSQKTRRVIQDKPNTAKHANNASRYHFLVTVLTRLVNVQTSTIFITHSNGFGPGCLGVEKRIGIVKPPFTAS